MKNKTIFDTNKKVNLDRVADAILSNRSIIFFMNNFFIYRENYYQPLDVLEIKQWAKEMIKEGFTSSKAVEVIRLLEIKRFVKLEDMDNEFLNLKNGLYDLEKDELYPHSPLFCHLNQLPINYDKNAKCPVWRDTLDKIFQGDQGKINLLQEFFGLCLTDETMYEAALFCVGKGANGKSTVLGVLERLVGEHNCSSVPLEKFSDSHYLADLHGKKVNLSIETSVKSQVYDNALKAIVSGDSITVDKKYEKPFSFKPTCKIVVATNNLPKVQDKTDAFYRRLLVLDFNRVFKPHEQDRTLKGDKGKLAKELDGILLWAIEGLKRLQKRDNFLETPEMIAAKDKYRKENNNVLLFVFSECQLNTSLSIGKTELYDAYKDWCKDNRHLAVNRIEFSNELEASFDVRDGRKSNVRNLEGINLNKNCTALVAKGAKPLKP